MYVNLARADGRTARFAAAVAADGRSYSPSLLLDAGEILRAFGLLPDADLDELDGLAATAAAAAAAAGPGGADDEAGAPDEFLDPIMGSLMADPVLLPASQQAKEATGWGLGERGWGRRAAWGSAEWHSPGGRQPAGLTSGAWSTFTPLLPTHLSRSWTGPPSSATCCPTRPTPSTGVRRFMCEGSRA